MDRRRERESWVGGGLGGGERVVVWGNLVAGCKLWVSLNDDGW